MAGVLKQTTNLTGLPVATHPKNTLNRLYKRILLVVSKMPENAAYRKHTEEIVKHRSSIVNSSESVKTMEEKIGCGQIEEVISQAKHELLLAENLLIVRPWETLMAPIPPNQWKWPMKTDLAVEYVKGQIRCRKQKYLNRLGDHPNQKATALLDEPHDLRRPLDSITRFQ